MAIKLESKMLSGRLPLLGKLPSARQLQILTGALVFFLLVDAAVVVARCAAEHLRHHVHRHRRQDPHAVAAPGQGGAAGLAG